MSVECWIGNLTASEGKVLERHPTVYSRQQAGQGSSLYHQRRVEGEGGYQLLGVVGSSVTRETSGCGRGQVRRQLLIKSHN